MDDVDSMIDVVYKCKICSAQSDSAEKLRRHVKKEHIENESALLKDDTLTEIAQETEMGQKINVIVDESPIMSIEKGDGFTNPVPYITKSGRKIKRRHLRRDLPKRRKNSLCSRCSVCGKRIGDSSELKLHQECHSDHNTFKCILCDYSSPQWSIVKIHMEIHNDPETYKCSDCGLSFASEVTLKNHWRFHHLGGKHLCDVCGYEAQSEYALFQHGMKHSKTFTCGLCEYSCDNQIDMDTHNKLRHDGGYVCKYCSGTQESFATKIDFQIHIREQHPKKKCFVCDKCNYVAKLKHHLRKHYLMHTGERPLKCNIEGCGYTSRDLRNLGQHIATKHSKPGDLVCRQCHFVTTNQNDYDVHTAMYHMKIYKCEHCDFEAKSSACIRRHRLSKHVAKDKMRYPCPHCSYVTNFRESLNKHFLTHALKDNRHRCVFCKEDFTSRVELKSHLTELHQSENIKLFFCDHCPYSCKKIQGLQSHMLTHSDEKPHKCKVCDYRSRTAIALKAHVLRKHHHVAHCETRHSTGVAP